MATTVIGTIGDARSARKLVHELVETGFRQQDVELLEGSEQEILAKVVARGFAEADARGYAKAARSGKTLVAARAPEDKVDAAVDIIERYEGAQEEVGTVQEVEEEFEVGKRQVATGGVRVTTQVSERPVEESVTLREERVEAERKPASRKLSAEEAEAAFEEKTVEMIGTSEQAAVRKQARVTGEVAVGKAVEKRQETVKDTVRRTEVEVEEVGAKGRKSR
jgi:stress response protein YsnF